ncbi:MULTISPECIES: winged helix-turn-helix transcriptional regulator [Bacillus]
MKREIFPKVPPHVEYSLTPKGREYIPIIDMMADLGKKLREKPK